MTCSRNYSGLTSISIWHFNIEKGYTGYNGRADKTSTGIGLYLCREITKKLGHGIMITSEIGKGTDVTIVFERNNLDVRD